MNTTLIKGQEALLAVIKCMPGNNLILLPDAPRYTIVEASEEYNRATFTTREEIIGKGIFDVFPDDPHDSFADGVENLSASFRLVTETRQIHEMPVQRYPIHSGSANQFIEKFWVPVNKPVIIDDEVVYIIHCVTDVTESKQLKSKDQYFKALADESPFMIWRSAGPSCIYVNEVWIATTGLSFAASLGSGIWDAIHRDDLDEQRRLFQESRWVFMKAVPILPNGPVIEYIGSLIDITELQIAAEQISESEKQFRQLANSIIQMVWVTDADGMHEYYNQRWYDFTGTTPEETEGEGWNHVFHPDDQQRAWKIWRNSLETGMPYEIEYRLRKFTGEYVWVLGRAAPYFDSTGKIIKWFGTCTDINEQKLLQQQKDEFINVASHELKTPLTGLKANIQFLEKMLLRNPDADRMLIRLVGSSYTNVKKLNKLIDELVNANSIGMGKLMIKKEWFNLVTLIQESTVGLSSEEHVIRLTGLADAIIYADPGKVEQVIVNLVNNAIKYAPESRVVDISVSHLESEFKVSVTDQGIGIAEDKLGFLFERYYQAQSTGSGYSGMGLGLYICANIIENHGGRIGVESTLGKGSTFWFTLPKDPVLIQ